MAVTPESETEQASTQPHRVGLPEHLMVPKAQHLFVSLFSQKISSRFVLFSAARLGKYIVALFSFGSLLPSVKLDYQAIFETAEIGDKRADSERGSQTRPLGLNLESLAPLAVRTSQTP